MSERPSDRQYDQNARIVYVDAQGSSHAALVTTWWGRPQADNEPPCNLVYLSDTAQGQSHTVQTATSVPHAQNRTPGHGFWYWEGDARYAAPAPGPHPPPPPPP